MRCVFERPPARRWVERYGLAVIAVGAAAGYAAVVAGVTSITPYILFALAVAAVAIRGGFWPGAVAVLLAALVSDFLFIEPRNELTLGRGTLYLATAYSAGLVGYLAATMARLPGRMSRPGSPVLPTTERFSTAPPQEE
jgi:K+-sensing histidine kinase KdpD